MCSSSALRFTGRPLGRASSGSTNSARSSCTSPWWPACCLPRRMDRAASWHRARPSSADIPPSALRRTTMFEAKAIEVDDKATFYREVAQQLEGLLSGERDAIANAANTAALLFTTLPDLNWAGFYILRSPDELVLGPFQGKQACVRIEVGRGV